MRSLLSVSGTLVVIFLLLYIDVFTFHDRSTFVPPPEAVTEGFFKMIETKRYPVASKFLTSENRQQLTKNTFKELDRSVRDRLGSYQIYNGKTNYYDGLTAMSNVRLKGSSAELWPVFLLKQEHGVWKIEKLLSLNTSFSSQESTNRSQ